VKRDEYDSCQVCGMNPGKPEFRGKQTYVCLRCGAIVCAECSEDGIPENYITVNPIVCRACSHEEHLERKERLADQR
jgi:DNA-directed RNA polymerase subunit RPC12/RpoP